VYIDGTWVVKSEYPYTEEFVPNPNTTRHNGTVVKVDWSDRTAVVRFTDHKYADSSEPKVKRIDFDQFYDRWEESRGRFVLQDI
jgi:hypothetical protein